MADQAKINEALLTLQRVMLGYSAQDVSGIDFQLADGQLPEGLFENISAFMDDLSGIEGVSRALHASGYQAKGAYESAIGAALQGALGGQVGDEIEKNLQENGEVAASAALRAQDAPELFIQNPALMAQFLKEDMAPMIGALDVLAAEKLLEAPPVAPELRADQPKAIRALKETLDNHISFYTDFLAEDKVYYAEQLAGLGADAKPEDKAAIEKRIADVESASALIAQARQEFDQADFSKFADDPHAQKALSNVVQYMQSYNSYTNFSDKSGVYSVGFEDHLQAVNTNNAALLEELNGYYFPDDTQRMHRDFLQRIAEFEPVMQEMVRTQAYIQPKGADIAADPVEQARPVIEGAIDYMTRKGKVGFDPVLGDADGGAFEYESRLTLQAFLVNLKLHLQIGDDAVNGAYTSGMRDGLVEKLKDPASVNSVAQEFFKGDTAKVSGLVAALDTYSNPALVPDIAGVPSNIARVNLLVMPEVKPSEVAVLKAAIDRVPTDEMGAINELATTLSGFGLNHILPIDAITAEQNAALAHVGQSRADVMAGLFEKVYAESQAALTRDGRPQDEIGSEIKARLAERLDSVLGGHSVYAASGREALNAYVDQAVTQGLQAYQAIGTNHEERLQAASSVFAGYIPATAGFLQVHGANERAYSAFRQDSMEGTTPHAIAGFAGALGNKTLAGFDAAAALPSVSALIDEMESGFFDMRHGPIGQRTLAGVRAGLEENRIMLERIYHETIVDDGAQTPLVVHDAHGETVLVIPDENGALKISYLDAHGFDGLSDPAVKSLTVGESFGYDRLMVQAALAGFQSHNQGVEFVRNYNPEFFSVAGKTYVVGIEKETSGLQIIPLDAALVNEANSADLHDYDNPAKVLETRERLQNDPAYAFIRSNYGHQYSAAGTADSVFKTMAEELSIAGHAGADKAAGVFVTHDSNMRYAEGPVPPVLPLEGAVRESALKNVFDSASGFEIEGKQVTLGQPIADSALLTEMLGYDPHEVFVTSRYDNPAAAYVVHGLEPPVWNSEHEIDPFLKDHLIVTYMKDDVIQSVAIAKADLENNPLRLPTILQNEHGLEEEITVYAANRYTALLSEQLGVTVNSENIWGYVQLNLMKYDEKGGVEPYPSGPVTPRFWGIDGDRYRDSHAITPADAPDKDDHSSLMVPSSGAPSTQAAVTRLAMIAESIDEMTLPVAEMDMAVSGGGIAPHRQVSLATMKV